MPDSVPADSGQDSVAEQLTVSEKVCELLQKANAGNASAQTSLGYRYCSGDGVGVDYKEAVKWFKKAADMGNADAMYWLGRCYFNGTGVEKNYSLATEWFRKAAHRIIGVPEFYLYINSCNTKLTG